MNQFSKIRVRFAPSPTGFLHLGGLRTALYNYLFGKSKDGKFILRIEDTDQNRLIKGSIEQIKNDLNWCGINIDEGPYNGEFGPYIQSKRLQIYKEHIKILLNNNSAYYCFCTDKRLGLIRKEAIKLRQIPKYDNRCRHLSNEKIKEYLNKGHPHCIRFKLSDDLTTFNDLIFGNINYNVTLNEGDPVILKSDGYPTYHFANVVDDHLMEISHVLRGVEWQISTTKHLQLYKAFNWQPPLFGHLPLLLNADGTKLSKRQGDIDIKHYRDIGIFPLALINFIVQSGGGFNKDLNNRHMKINCYTIDELSKQFNLENINSHSGKLMKNQLSEFNRLALKHQLNMNDNQLIHQVKDMILNNLPKENLLIDDDYIRTILNWSSNRITKLTDLVSNDFNFIWILPKITEYNLENNKIIQLLLNELDKIDDFDKISLNKCLINFCENENIKYSNLMKILRTILSGLEKGPSVGEMMEILGKSNTIKRLQLSLLNN